MSSFFHMAFLFFAQMLDNALNTTKTILIQRNRCLLAGLCLAVSNYIYLHITRDVVSSDGNLAMIVVSIASGLGCCLAVAVSNRFSRERTYVNIIMSDNREAMQDFRGFLAEHHITNVTTDSYTLDWERKTITITAYAETREQHRLIGAYIEESPLKFKRVIQKA
ncbi:MAG: hypothetical protein IJB51_13000 [Clostridia bacterium]|nr:hypothetical protein [Clostridia bacterium]